MEEKLFKENIQDISISKEVESSFIDYAMSVIVSRAIPDAKDGLKPVHRRILFAMNELNLSHTASFRKSASAVGEVIAKYHPHGDSSIYEALVRMAQPFSLRYPLVWGQGNFGSVDGDSAAAMRYTEAKLKKITSLLLEDIKKDTVDFRENYDGSILEPIVLPGKFPNLLVNGSTGIAVGMATSIPPHNLKEVLNAAEALLLNPELDSIDLMEFVFAPDFPTGGILVNKNEIPEAYKTGRGRAIVRSKVEIKFDEKKNAGTIYITEIPYMVNKSSLILKIADLVKNKTIESISGIKDESNRKGIRIVIRLKKGFIPEVELNKLFKLTPLQSSFPINILALVNERPATLNLRDAVDVYNKHQIDILVRKTLFELKKAADRKHILEGLHIALDNIDEIISLIRGSIDNKEALINLKRRFELSEIQAKAILEMKLNRLTGLERSNLTSEIQKLDEMIIDYKLVIDSKEEQIERTITMYKNISETFGDERRTFVSNETLTNITDEDLIPKEDVVITLSRKGYIKRLPIDEYRVQNRGGTGSKGATTTEGDYIKDILITSTHTDLLFFTSLGKVYRIRAHRIPQLGKTAKGLPLINLVQIEKDTEEVRAVISIKDYKDNDLFFVTKKGVVKRTPAIMFERINRNGKKAITLKENDQLLGVTPTPSLEGIDIILGNSNGKAIRFKSTDVRSMGRTAAGVKGIKIDDGDVVVDYSSTKSNLVLSISENGFGKLTDLENYRVTKRGGKGIITINTSKAGALIGLTSVKGDEDLMIITDRGTIIRTPLSKISQFSRNSKGVTIVKLRNEEKITSTSIIRSIEDIEEEIIEITKETNLEIKENE